MENLDSIVRRCDVHHRVASARSERQRLLVSAVSEPSEKSCAETILMVSSLRRFGGLQKDADVRIYFVEEYPEDAGKLLDLGVELRLASRFDTRCPHANKLAMFADVDGYDYLLAIDTDTVFVGDPTSHLLGSAVASRPEANDHFGQVRWTALLEHLELPLPSDRYLTPLTRTEPLVPYFNSGVLLVPAALADPLRSAWASWVLRLLEEAATYAPLAQHGFFVDQLALALALVETGIPRRELPATMNMQSCYPMHPAFAPDDLEPVIVHHHRFGASGVHRGVHTRMNEAIERLNAELFTSGDAELAS